jgi:hypothetical protein
MTGVGQVRSANTTRGSETMSDTVPSSPTRHSPHARSVRAWLVGLAVGVASLGLAPAASAAYGEDYGFAPINDGAGPAPEVAAIPPTVEGNQAFWAGACNRALAPAPGVAIGSSGFGARTPDILVPNAPVSPPRISVPAPQFPQHCIDWGAVDSGTDNTLWNTIPAWRLAAEARAGAHPDGSALMVFNREPDGRIAGALDNVVVDLPAGFVGNPEAVPVCTAEQFAVKPPRCPPASQVGVLNLYIPGPAGLGGTNLGGTDDSIYPVWNLEPRKGRPAELGFAYASGERATTIRLEAKVRSGSDNGVTAFVGQVPAALPPIAQAITLWGVPWEAANDLWRAPADLAPADGGCTVQPGSVAFHYLPPGGLTPACRVPYQAGWGPVRPFLTNETDCNQAPVTVARVDTYQFPGSSTAWGEPNPADANWSTGSAAAPAVHDCHSLGFAPDIDFAATSADADGASGLGVELSIPQNNDARDSAGNLLAAPSAGVSEGQLADYVDAATDYFRSDAGRATAHLKDSVVALPEGMSVNPSAATGLVACPDSVIGVRDASKSPPLFYVNDPSDGLGGDDCPDGSRIGTVEVRTPLLDEPLTGDVILGEPKSTDPRSGEMFRVFLIVRSQERGLLVKIYGTAAADPDTGRLTATFENNPELPFHDLDLDFKQGSRGLFALPQRCGSPGWTAAFTPWSAVGAASTVADRPDNGALAVAQGCANAFTPGLDAGMNEIAARSSGTFSFRFSRQQGEQYLRGLTTTLPKGLLASVRDVPLCSNAAANAGACPAGSKIGIVDAKAGSGDPFVLEEKGEVFLTQGYKGGAYGLAVKIRPIAGPFRGNMELSPIIVRQAIHVDRKTAQVTAVSDPLPLIHHGVPLRVREVTVLVNRGGFMLNPSDCAAKQVAATLTSDQGANTGLTNGFQAANCASLAFKPKLALRLTGRKQVRTGKHPGIKATVTQKGTSEAGIEKAEVRLPKSLALDVDNAQALCEYEDGTKPDLENHCPKGSIVGRSRAVSPLLNDPLVGNVYFVKNVRRSSSGNLIRTLPMIVVALRGEIAINLVGESNVKKGKLVNTFDQVPDAPISRFNLNINGGRNGIIAVTRTRRGLINLCAKPKSHAAEADMDGHNGRRYDRDVRMKTPCGKKSKKTAAQKRKAAQRKAAVKRRAARR